MSGHLVQTISAFNTLFVCLVTGPAADPFTGDPDHGLKSTSSGFSFRSGLGILRSMKYSFNFFFPPLPKRSIRSPGAALQDQRGLMRFIIHERLHGSSFISRRVGFLISSRWIVLSISFRWIVAGISTPYSNRGCDVFSPDLRSPSFLILRPSVRHGSRKGDRANGIGRIQLAGERQDRLDMAITDAVFRRTAASSSNLMMRPWRPHAAREGLRPERSPPAAFGASPTCR